MDASGMLPPQKKTRSTNNRHIAAEMVEEILLNLPVKSLLRFSTASKSWNSTIFNSGFVKRYRRRAARVRIALVHSFSEKTSSCLISNKPTVDATDDFVFLFGGRNSVVAACDDLWLSRDGNSFYLWNPSMRSFKKLPEPSSWPNYEVEFVHGLGYESVGDDYKILRFPPEYPSYRAELYSLRSDCWKIIEDLPTKEGTIRGFCAFVSGKLHFESITNYAPSRAMTCFITCFDLLTEKFGEVALPNYSLESWHVMHVSVLRGMLCVSITYSENFRDIWVMEKYGVAGSWSKKFSIAYSFKPLYGMDYVLHFPLYLYENGEILISFTHGRYLYREFGNLFVYSEDGKSSVKLSNRGVNKIVCPFVYVDSLVAPAMWIKT